MILYMDPFSRHRPGNGPSFQWTNEAQQFPHLMLLFSFALAGEEGGVNEERNWKYQKEQTVNTLFKQEGVAVQGELSPMKLYIPALIFQPPD